MSPKANSDGRKADRADSAPTGSVRPKRRGAVHTSAGPAVEQVIPLTSWRPGTAIVAAFRQQTVTVNLPVVGAATLPSGPHIAWYAGLATLAVLEVVEWPVAIFMVAAKALADSTHHQLLSQFGDAIEHGT